MFGPKGERPNRCSEPRGCVHSDSETERTASSPNQFLNQFTSSPLNVKGWSDRLSGFVEQNHSNDHMNAVKRRALSGSRGARKTPRGRLHAEKKENSSRKCGGGRKRENEGRMGGQEDRVPTACSCTSSRHEQDFGRDDQGRRGFSCSRQGTATGSQRGARWTPKERKKRTCERF